MINFLHYQKKFPQIYIKEFPFHLNKKAMQRVRILGEFLGVILLTAFIAYILLSNFAPLGVTTEYNSLNDHKDISELGPKNRVKTEINNGSIIYHQFHDLIYFNTNMPFPFETAKVRITFKNTDPTQTLSVGFQDQELWHYNTKALDVPFLNNLSWKKDGDNPILYQREKHFDSVDAFLANPPKDLLIGTYAYEPGFEKSLDTQLNDYSPASQATIIDTPLRGKHTIYAYLKNEPFKMTIQKQDLNWYEDPDVMTIKVYKDRDLVFQTTADDDGIIDNSKKVLTPQEVTIKNPGSDLPESGIYKIVIEGNGDSIIKRITTNLHKLVFAGSLFPMGNHDVYPQLIASTAATTVYTNALLLSAMSYHNAGLQKIQVGNQFLDVDTIKINKSITPPDPITQIILPKNDVLLNGFQGYFAFAENQFFLPTPYRIVPLTNKEDTEMVDYILTSYHPARKIDDWQVNELTFDIRSAFIKNGRLSWIITAPGLKDNNHEILIKNIDITFNKKPWI